MKKAILQALFSLFSSLLFILSGIEATAEPILIDDFTQGPRAAWKPKEFEGRTLYSPATEDNIPCLKASADGTASGLFYEIKYDPGRYPILTWKWKVDDIVDKGDATTKAGDDYAARIYVVFHSIFFWNTKALNYVWANRLPRGEAIANSFTSNAMMVAVESGRDNAGKWVEHRRNIHEDFIKYFGSPPSDVEAIAIMTDTDNTGSRASACYGPIYIDSAEK